MNKRMVPALNSSVPYEEGTWMVAVRDASGDNVYLVGPDERIDLVVRGGDMRERINLARQIAAQLNALPSLLHFSECIEVSEDDDYFDEFHKAQEQARAARD